MTLTALYLFILTITSIHLVRIIVKTYICNFAYNIKLIKFSIFIF